MQYIKLGIVETELLHGLAENISILFYKDFDAYDYSYHMYYHHIKFGNSLSDFISTLPESSDKHYSINWIFLFYYNPDIELSLMPMYRFGRPTSCKEYPELTR